MKSTSFPSATQFEVKEATNSRLSPGVPDWYSEYAESSRSRNSASFCAPVLPFSSRAASLSSSVFLSVKSAALRSSKRSRAPRGHAPFDTPRPDAEPTTSPFKPRHWGT